MTVLFHPSAYSPSAAASSEVATGTLWSCGSANGRKDSAGGTRSVNDALRSFSIRTVVATKLTDANKHLLNEIVDGQESSFLSTRFIL